MRIAVPCAIGLLCLGNLLPAQETDTIVLKNDSRKFTLVSQIEDAAEASAFLSLVSAKGPAERSQLAQTFLNRYPKSWLLAQTYDLLARSCIDLGKYDDAVAYGELSLRLLPENPSLLVLMANVEAKKGEGRRAMEEATNALEYLNKIERPANMNQGEWDAIRPQMQASAYFARARAEAKSNRPDALDDLNRAAAWNPDDAEVFYLRAIVELQTGQKNAAASDLAFVLGTGFPLREKAKSILAVLAGGTPIDSFVTTLAPRRIDKELRIASSVNYNQRALASGYAGPAVCEGCHEKEYSAWRQTGMARMLQPYAAANIMGDFSTSTEYKEGSDVVRLGSKGRPYFEFYDSGAWTRYNVDFTIGSKWQQGYATQLPDGRLQVLPIEYNLLEKKWINYWKILDPPGSLRANIREFPNLTSATNYQQNCAICHTSQLKADVFSPTSMEHATYKEPGIDCEMCHGPSALHAREPGKTVPLDFRKISNRDGVRVCAQCHRQSAVREIGEGGEMNYSTRGNFVPVTWLRPYDAFSRKAFYKDGRFRETTFIVEAFTRSACYLRGAAQCATCHSPHLGDFAKNETSLKFKNDPNEMCLGCHSEFRKRVAGHSHHLASSEASQCITCHMPRIANALLFKASSHQIEVPSADLTERFGQQDSPNVCLTCHSEKGIAWAKEQLAEWRH